MQDLFAATYSPYAAAVPMYGSPYGIGYNMQYNPAMMPFQPQVKSQKSLFLYLCHQHKLKIQGF